MASESYLLALYKTATGEPRGNHKAGLQPGLAPDLSRSEQTLRAVINPNVRFSADI
jgi:hypothetical protein